MAKTILITGSNRGLGLEFTRQYAIEGWRVIACCRNVNDAADLQMLKTQYSNIEILSLDVTDEEQLKSLQQKINFPIDILINNAGFLEVDPPLGDISSQTMIKSFLINALGPLKLIEALKEQVAKSERKLIVVLSSSMGSISENSSGGYYSYRASKAALNMIMKSLSIDLAPSHIDVLVLHPGWVKTRMGGASAQLQTQDSVKGMRQVIENYPSSPGTVKFMRYNGEIIPW
ncbi:MAG: SDR family oxidoreductase [Proteobacteria bacterium]|nr:SDR family oxidoreductase [Pseudomonadota bacterium]